MLKQLVLFLAILCVTLAKSPLDALRPFSTDETQTAAVSALLNRILKPEHVRQISINVNSSLFAAHNFTEVSIIEPEADPQLAVSIHASSGAAAVFGVQFYLRNCCGIHWSWDGVQIESLPDRLPPHAVVETLTSIGRFGYFSNVCTLSYSQIWWDWNRWERHIDWMAAQGLNLPLTFVGQEYFLLQMYRGLGLSDGQILEYISGPAFLAWNRMGNLKAWGANWDGAVLASTGFIEQQFELLKKILQRQVELGMVPVLPGFAGHVPDGLKIYEKNATYDTLKWGGFNCSYTCTLFLEPTDPLFEELTSLYIQTMKKELGTLYHAYNVDLFNEMVPKSYGPDYISPTVKAVYNAMAKADPDAIWVEQAWFLETPAWLKSNGTLEALMKSVPQDRLLLLDLYSDLRPIWTQTKSYLGQPFIFNTLHNFGGKNGIYGWLDSLRENILSTAGTTVTGYGLTMEGMFTNYIMYQYTVDLAWKSDMRDHFPQNDWVGAYVQQRYKTTNDHTILAWKTVVNEFYTGNTGGMNDLVTKMPTMQSGVEDVDGILTGQRIEREQIASPNGGPNYTVACGAWQSLINLAAATPYAVNELQMHDLVDLTAQILIGAVADPMIKNISAAYKTKNATAVADFGGKLRELLNDIDDLLGYIQSYKLSTWVDAARARATPDTDPDLFEFNARNQITLWGPNGEIRDYARKRWSGLIGPYYGARYNLFVSMLLESLATGKEFDQSTYTSRAYHEIEWPFQHARSTSQRSNDTWSAVKFMQVLVEKYGGMCA